MAVPITNIKMSDIASEVDGETSLLKPVSGYFKSPNVIASGLDPTYCSGANAYVRLANLRNTPYQIGKFRNYNKNAVSYNWRSGLYYDWWAASKVAVPVGWRVATDTDWLNIFSSIDSNFQYGSNAIGHLFKSGLTESQNSFSGWHANAGNNNTGFNAHATGVKWASASNQGYWDLQNYACYFWMITSDFSNPNVWKYSVTLNSLTNQIDIFPSWSLFEEWTGEGHYDMVNIRLVRNSSIDPGYVEDVDGNIYKTVKIGNYVITAENLRTTKDINGNTFTDIGSGDIVFTNLGIVSSVALQYDQP